MWNSIEEIMETQLWIPCLLFDATPLRTSFVMVQCFFDDREIRLSLTYCFATLSPYGCDEAIEAVFNNNDNNVFIPRFTYSTL